FGRHLADNSTMPRGFRPPFLLVFSLGMAGSQWVFADPPGEPPLAESGIAACANGKAVRLAGVLGKLFEQSRTTPAQAMIDRAMDIWHEEDAVASAGDARAMAAMEG